MGHGGCGGVAASLAGHGEPSESFIDGWIALLDGARDRVRAAAPADPQRALEYEGVRDSLANLRTFPFVAEREAIGTLALHGCYFAIAEGCLYELHEDEGRFHAVSGDCE
jgi:carbonic anhydrase